MKFQSAIDAIVLSYDDHMKKIIPKPKLLPIRINILIEQKNNFKFENIHLKPYDNLNDLLRLLEEYVQKKGDNILNWNKDSLTFILTGPLRNSNINDSVFQL